MRKVFLTITCITAAALAGCGGTTSQQAEVPASTTSPAPATPTQEAATTPPPPTAQAAPSAATPAPSGQAAPARSRPASTPPAGGTQMPTPTATAYKPPAPPKPEMIEIPAGSVLEMELVEPLSSKTNVVGDVFHARVTDAVTVGAQEVIPAGSMVEGTVTEAVSAKKMSGQASLSLEFSKLTLPDGKSVAISAMLTEKGKKIGKRTGAVVGGSAAGGALLGRIIGKDTKGAVVGGLLGAAVGTGVAATQKGQELKLPEGTAFSVEMSAPAQVPVPAKRS